MFLNNPFSKPAFKVFTTFVESELFLLHIMLVFVSGAGVNADKESEVALTKWWLYTILLIYATYIVFAIAVLFYLAVVLGKKYYKIYQDRG
jgi:hypothetical protein